MSPIDKGWTARVPKSLTSAEFPGTAILWEESYFEVVAAERQRRGAMRYVLEPWRETLTMRLIDRYDAESEGRRIEEQRKALQRAGARKWANAMGVLTGHLPAIVQQELASELGIHSPRLTLISIAGEYAVLAALILFSVNRLMEGGTRPAGVLIAAAFRAAEGAIRFAVNWTQSRAIGSIVGWIGYALYHAVSARGPSPFAVEKGQATTITTAPAEVAAHDAFTMREPFLTLLAPAEQARAAMLHGYDYRHESTTVAVMILFFCAVCAVSSYTMKAPLSLLAAGALGVEQIFRLIAFRRGPAGSVLRFAVRPFVRKLLA